MDALVMCGGRGTRLAADIEKPLYPIAGGPMVERVIAALRTSRIDRVHAVTSPHAPETTALLDGERASGCNPDGPSAQRSVGLIEAPGSGYVGDLQYALDRVDSPVLTVAADLALLTGTTVDEVIDAYEGGDVTVCIPRALPDRIGASVGADAVFEPAGDGGRANLVATGLNVVDTDSSSASTPLVLEEPRLAVNVNTLEDAMLADRLLHSERIDDPTARPREVSRS